MALFLTWSELICSVLAHLVAHKFSLLTLMTFIATCDHALDESLLCVLYEDQAYNITK